MELPAKTLQISLKLFNDVRGKKDIAFAVYLHELTHYFQRIDCKTYQDSNSDEFEAKEWGFELETCLFGGHLKSITDAAAACLEGEVSHSGEEF